MSKLIRQHMTKVRESKDNGFTLIELLVVMIIIGILASIATPVYLTQRQKAVETAIKSDVRQMATEQLTYGLDGSGYLNAAQLNAAGAKYHTSSDVKVYVLWANTTGFCAVGTSPKAGKDTSGMGAYAGVTTKIFYVGADGKMGEVKSSDPGCVTAGPSSVSGGYFDSSGYRSS